MQVALSLDETIAATASPPGKSLRGIIRVSGLHVRDVLQKLLGHDPFPESVPTARSAQVHIPIADGTATLPATLLYWPNRRSFTGEPLAELHLPGIPPLIEEVLELVYLSGARPAERGEFTLRAFMAGRIDLVQAEAVLGVIDASSQQELETALSQLAGGISGRIAELREQLLLHLSDLEAGLDFVEEDIEFVSRDELMRRLTEAEQWLEVLIEQSARRMQTTGRRRVVLAGLPNAGKSTLFNALAGQTAALVSPIPGTTRDYLTISMNSAGVPIDLVDTAGWEDARDGIEAAASVLRNEQYERADLVVWCQAAELTQSEQAMNAELLQQLEERQLPVLKVVTKADQRSSTAAPDALRISAFTGVGLADLQESIAQVLSLNADDSEMIGATAARCAESLQHALQGVVKSKQALTWQAGDELIALELRDVLEHLGRIVGQVYTDDILDRIFTRFCIGK